MPYAQFSDYAPDNAQLNEDSSAFTQNALPSAAGFDSTPSLVSVLPALPEACVSIAAFSENNESFIIAGSQTHLYRYIAGAWIDVTRQDDKGNPDPYHVFGEYGWNFISFQQCPMGTGDGERPQVWDFSLQRFRDVKNTWQIPNAQPAANPADNPQLDPVPFARNICCNNEFVFLLSADEKMSRMYQSGTRQPECWQVGQQDCAYNDFDVGGEVMFVGQATSPIILLRKGIYQARRADVTGAFSFVKVATGIGCFYYNAACALNDTTYFIDEYGFFAISDDGALKPIGFNKVNKWIHDILTVHIPECRINCFADERNMRVYWNFYPNKTPIPKSAEFPVGDSFPPFSLVYDVLRDEWTKVTHGGLAACSAPWKAFSLDDLTQPAELGYNNPSAPSLDTTQYLYDGFVPMFLSEDGTQVLLQAGLAEEAILQSAWQGDTAQGMVIINKIQPLIDMPDFVCECQIKGDATLGHRPFYTPWARQSTIDGACRVMFRGRTAKVRVKIPYGAIWSKALGIDADVKPCGMR